jgi:hypothetical protein
LVAAALLAPALAPGGARLYAQEAPTRAAPAPAATRVAGTVRDQAGNPVPGARVRLDTAATAAEAVTDARGRFTLVAPPGTVGPRTVQVRALGYAPVTAPVVLAAGETAAVTLTLDGARLLGRVDVRAAGWRSRLRNEIAGRQLRGLGAYADSTYFAAYGPHNLHQAFDGIRGLRARRDDPSRGGEIRFAARGREPTPDGRLGARRVRVLLDGMPDLGIIESGALSGEEIALVEYYPSLVELPQYYREGQTGLLIVWTKAFLSTPDPIAALAAGEATR